MHILRLITNIAVILSARLCSPIIRMGLIILLSRFLGAQGLGEFQVILTYSAIFEALAGLGLWTLVTREVAKDRVQAFRYLLHGILLGTLTILTLAIPMNLLSVGYSSTIRLGIFILTFALLPAMILVFCEAVLVALEHAGDIALLTLIENIFLVGVGAILLWSGFGIVSIALCILTLRMLTALLGLARVVRLCPVIRWDIEWTFCQELLWHVPIFLGSALAWILFSRVDVLVLSRMRPIEEVGLYTAAVRILTMCQEIPQSILVTTFPLLAALYPVSKSRFRELTEQMIKYLLILSLPITIGGVVLAHNIISFLFKEQFLLSAPILQVIIWSFLPFGIMKLCGSALIATNNQKYDFLINYTVLLFNLMLNIAFISWYGTIGASYTLVLTTGLALTLRLATLWKLVSGLSLDRRLISALLATLGLWGILEQVKALPVFYVILGSVPVYLAFLVLLRTFTRAEMRRIFGARRWMETPWVVKFFPDISVPTV